MKQPINFAGTYPSNWAGYRYKEALGYTTGVHTGVDYNGAGAGNADLGLPVYAIADGIVRLAANHTNLGFGNTLIIETDGCPPGVSGTKLYHRYMHLQGFAVGINQQVKAGQKIGTVGNTGTVYAHLHLDTWTNRNGLGVHLNYDKNTQLASYEDPYWLIANNPNWNGADDMALTRDLIIKEYIVNRGQAPTEAEIATHLNGGTLQSLSLGFKAENDAYRAFNQKTIADLQAALANEQAKPPKEIVKEVDRIVTEYVDRPVEVIKTVEVTPAWATKIQSFVTSAIEFVKQIVKKEK